MKNPEVYKQQALYWQNYRIIDRTVTACVHLEDKDDRHSDYFPWNHGKFICKGKENGHVQAYAPTGAMGLKRWGGLTSKLDGYPVTSDPHLWWQACP